MDDLHSHSCKFSLHSSNAHTVYVYGCRTSPLCVCVCTMFCQASLSFNVNSVLKPCYLNHMFATCPACVLGGLHLLFRIQQVAFAGKRSLYCKQSPPLFKGCLLRWREASPMTNTGMEHASPQVALLPQLMLLFAAIKSKCWCTTAVVLVASGVCCELTCISLPRQV